MSRKAGYSAHSLSPHCRFISREWKKIIFFPPNWVSTKVGTEIVCRYNAPKNLNSQHTPQFGQPKHAPETSQLCPLMPLNSSSKQTKATRILRLHVYITKFLSKSQIFTSSSVSYQEVKTLTHVNYCTEK